MVAITGLVLSAIATLAAVVALYYAKKAIDKSTEALALQMSLESIGQMQRVADHLYELIDAAREEYAHPHERVTTPAGLELTPSRLPALHARLRIDVVALSQMGGIDLRGELPDPGAGDPESNLKVWTNTLGLLSELAEIAEATAEPKPPPPELPPSVVSSPELAGKQQEQTASPSQP